MPLNLPRHGNGLDKSQEIQRRFEKLGAENLSDVRTASPYQTQGDVSFAVPRYFDPRYQNPMGVENGRLDLYGNEEQRKKLQEWMRVFYDTHPIVGSIIDMYSRYPVSGIDLRDNDPEIKKFYEELFMNDLDYESLLIDIGREFWLIGECAAFGTWDEQLGIWVAEDLLDTGNLEVERMPFSTETSFWLNVDDDMRSMVNSGSPESAMFREQQPELWSIISKGEQIPISEDNLFWACRQSRRGDLRGTPILLRALRTLRMEDRMSSAMQATAERLYSPMIMFKLGMKMDDGTPLMPTPGMINQFKNNFNAALNSDFRAIFTHFMVEEKELFTNFRLGNWKQDWDMFDEKIYACFGMSADMVKASQSQTYASTALRFDLISQFMKTHQRTLLNFYRKRARKVAEAQEFWETDEDGNIVQETYKTVDEETGEEVIVQKPKPHFPEMRMRVINFRDEKTQREFLESLRKNEIPVSGEDLAVGVDIDLSESADKLKEEKIRNSVKEAETHMAILEATAGQGLPIPPATKKFFKDGVMPLRFKDWFDGDIVPVNEEGPGDGDSSLLDGITDQPSEYEDERYTRPEVSDEAREDMPQSEGV